MNSKGQELKSFYKNKKVFVTGHTGFKGSWLCQTLSMMGAEVRGYSLAPEENHALFYMAEIDRQAESVFQDVRNKEALQEAMAEFQPEIVFHLAAQPLVRKSYEQPAYTYEVNAMGTVNLFEAVRQVDSVGSVVNVTTDKVYENQEWCWGYRENERLNGYDPYSNSKSCSELITETYKRCFLKIPVSSMRAGNVIGGGDFAVDRIIPDCVGAVLSSDGPEPILVRNPHAVRPYQHVLEPLHAYLLAAMKQCADPSLAGTYNVGPDRSDCVTTGQLANLFCKCWGQGARWIDQSEKNPVHEANFLALDSTKIKNILGYESKWTIEEAVEKTVDWFKAYQDGANISKCMEYQVREFFDW